MKLDNIRSNCLVLWCRINFYSLSLSLRSSNWQLSQLRYKRGGAASRVGDPKLMGSNLATASAVTLIQP